MSIAQQILGILDENQDKIQEGFYLKLANKLLSLHKGEKKVVGEFNRILRNERETTDQLLNENRQIKEALRDEQEYSDGLMRLSSKLDLELIDIKNETKRLKKEIKELKNRREKIVCVCGCSMSKASLKRHMKTKKHKILLKSV